MRLQRNLTGGLKGKYSIIDNRTGRVIDGPVFTEDEFFVLKLKDRHALPALIAYANSIHDTDPEMADDVFQLASRAGEFSRWCKEPD